MRIAGFLNHSLVNGEGVRFALFLQGCGHHCKGCQNPQTWDFDGGVETTVEEIANIIKREKCLDGITLSGGDPFFQQEECVKLLNLLPGWNVWIYTGYEFDEIKDTELAQLADVLVVGKYVEELKCEGQLFGSSNQKIIRMHEPDGCESCMFEPQISKEEGVSDGGDD